MTVWGLRATYNGFEAVEIVKETDKTVVYKHSAWGDTRTDKGKMPAWRGDEDTARRLAAKMSSAAAEYERRVRDARNWYEKRKSELLDQPPPPDNTDV